MVSGGQNTEPIAPKSIILPTADGTIANPNHGQIIISGVKLLYCSGSNWYRIDSDDDA